MFENMYFTISKWANKCNALRKDTMYHMTNACPSTYYLINGSSLYHIKNQNQFYWPSMVWYLFGLVPQNYLSWLRLSRYFIYLSTFLTARHMSEVKSLNSYHAEMSLHAALLHPQNCIYFLPYRNDFKKLHSTAHSTRLHQNTHIRKIEGAEEKKSGAKFLTNRTTISTSVY